MTTEGTALPLVKELFQALSRGKHLCIDDGPLYRALSAHTDEYSSLFALLGFTLRHHPRNFFYFDGKVVGEAAQRIAVFFYVLVEHVGGHGFVVEEALMTRVWRLGELPHLTTERYREYMRQVGIPNDEDLRRLVSQMDHLGFIAVENDDMLRFRAPTYRLLDLCMAAASRRDASTTDGVAS